MSRLLAPLLFLLCAAAQAGVDRAIVAFFRKQL